MPRLMAQWKVPHLVPRGCEFCPIYKDRARQTVTLQQRGFSRTSPCTFQSPFARGIMEGVTMVLLRMIEATRNLGVNVEEIRSLSGGAKSRAWCQIKANASGLPVHTMKTTDIAACLGAAILAGVGAGVWSSIVDAASELAKYDLEYKPEERYKAMYDSMLVEYKLLTKELAPAFKRTALAGSGGGG